MTVPFTPDQWSSVYGKLGNQELQRLPDFRTPLATCRDGARLWARLVFGDSASNSLSLQGLSELRQISFLLPA